MTARRSLSMAAGIVKWFNGQKSFGFLQHDDGSRDVWVQISAAEKVGLFASVKAKSSATR